MDKHDKQSSKGTELTPAQRKEQLLRDGEFYRAGVANAKAQIKHGARPEVLFHAAVDHASYAIRGRVDSILRPTGISVASMAPYALTALRFIRAKRLGKPAIALGLVAGGVALYLQRYRARQQEAASTQY